MFKGKDYVESVGTAEQVVSLVCSSPVMHDSSKNQVQVPDGSSFYFLHYVSGRVAQLRLAAALLALRYPLPMTTNHDAPRHFVFFVFPRELQAPGTVHLKLELLLSPVHQHIFLILHGTVYGFIVIISFSIT